MNFEVKKVSKDYQIISWNRIIEELKKHNNGDENLKINNCIAHGKKYNKAIRVTVLTTTYNRAHTLIRLYESLISQSDYSFKWLIVDDGSVDNTRELVDSFNNTFFSIRYVNKENGGKHTAINMGMKLIDTEYTIIVDSDDRLCKNAIRLVNKWIKEIEGLDNFAGVAGTRISDAGTIIGEFKSKEYYVDCYNSCRRRKGLLGDKAEIYKTALLKENPFPVFENEKFVPENVVWNKFSLMNLKLRWYNEGIIICEYLEGGLTAQTHKSLFFKENFNGYKEECKINIKALPFPYNYSAGSVFYARCIDTEIYKNAFDRMDISFIDKFLMRVLGRIRYKLERY